jgi:hypothetical protein
MGIWVAYHFQPYMKPFFPPHMLFYIWVSPDSRDGYLGRMANKKPRSHNARKVISGFLVMKLTTISRMPYK